MDGSGRQSSGVSCCAGRTTRSLELVLTPTDSELAALPESMVLLCSIILSNHAAYVAAMYLQS